MKTHIYNYQNLKKSMGLIIACTTLAIAMLSCGIKPVAENRLVVHAERGEITINRNIYSHFSEHLGRCIYGGIWVGEDSPIPNTRGIRNDIIEALREIEIPVLRWPGGCFADEYHWRDGIGPRENRPTMVNTHWGGVTENNHFGTHEFLDLCELIGAEPYISGNVGSGTVEELADWVEYVTFDGVSPLADERRKNGREEPWNVSYWGIGNETWGCGGYMRAEYYADIYRVFQTYVRAFGESKPFKIASGAYGEDYHWTETLMKNVDPEAMQGVGVHYYTVFPSWENKGSATELTEDNWFGTMHEMLEIEGILNGHEAVMEKYDPDGDVALLVDEWGTWHDVEEDTNPGFLYQQNTVLDALVAAASLNIFNAHARRVKMANIAQTVNVLQAMILTDDDKMILTPTYHVFDLFKVHQDAILLPSELTSVEYEYEEFSIPALIASASRDARGRIHISICNLNPNEDLELTCELPGVNPTSITGQVITGPDMTSHNTFDNPEVVVPKTYDGARINGDEVVLTLPAKSVVMLEII